MKSTIVFLASVGSLASAASPPACATSCLSSAIASAGCAVADVGCHCGSAASLISQYAGPCLASSCNATDQAAAQSFGQSMCSLYSATATGTGATLLPTGNLTIQTSTPSSYAASTTKSIKTTTGSGSNLTTTRTSTKSTSATLLTTASSSASSSASSTASGSSTSSLSSSTSAAAAAAMATAGPMALGAGLMALFGAVVAL